jgi:hypothetical protein
MASNGVKNTTEMIAVPTRVKKSCCIFALPAGARHDVAPMTHREPPWKDSHPDFDHKKTQKPKPKIP